ncbi:IgGFc-binding protein-like [Mytilus trossulus]|uniref:IgGFc-binding protein-like n=1 Tax=Mytilus trossulus TaxID=6551 RepID=UPI0030046A79
MSIDVWLNIGHIGLYGHENKTEFLIGQNVALTGVVSSEGISKQCAMISSNDPVRIYAFLKDADSMEGFLVIPLEFLSTNYVIPSFFVQPEAYFYRNKDSVFAIGVLYSNTTINITLQIDDGSITYEGTNYTTNQTLSIVLDEKTIFQLSHDTDLTGTTISASNPIAIVSGNRCNTVATPKPDSSFYCQPFMEMILPVNQLDNEYVIPKLALRVNNTVRILSVNHTEVTIQKADSIISTSTIMSGAFIDFQYDNISSVRSMSDIMVMLYPEDQNIRIGSFMMTVTGIHQYLYEYDFIVPYVRYVNFISITVKSDELNGFILDGQLLNVQDVFDITHNSDLFSSFSLPISPGEHYIVHATKARFGLWVYGEKYGYQGGMAFKT